MANRGIVTRVDKTGYATIAREHGGSAAIAGDNSTRLYAMHVEDIVNGGEEDLKPHVRVAFDIVNVDTNKTSRARTTLWRPYSDVHEDEDEDFEMKRVRYKGTAVNVSIVGLQQYFGTAECSADLAKEQCDIACVRHQDGSTKCVNFHDIFRKFPSKITPGMKLTYNLSPKGRPRNVRFEDSALTSNGKIVYFDEDRKIGRIRARGSSGREENVFFMLKAVINHDVQADAYFYRKYRNVSVAFEYERVCAPKRMEQIRKGEISGIRATNICIQPSGVSTSGLSNIQEDQHIDVAEHIVPNEEVGTSSMTGCASAFVPDSWEHLLFFDEEGLDQIGVSAPASTPAGYSTSETEVELVCLSFSRNPAQLHELLERHSGFRRRSKCGACLFVPDSLHESIEAKSDEMKLGRSHAILTLDMEKSVMDDVLSLKRSFKISVSKREVFKVKTNDEEDNSDDDQISKSEHNNSSDQTCQLPCLRIKNTFFYIPVPPSLFSEPSGGPRVASESVVSHGEIDSNSNPRSKVKK